MPDTQAHHYTDVLNALLKSLQSVSALQGFQNDVLSQTLNQSETIVCILERISKQTCESLNEIHSQTRLQESMQASLNTLVELFKSTHPEAALELARLAKIREQLLACCPPKEKEPVCVYEPCTSLDPSPGSGSSLSATAPPNKVCDAQFPHFDIEAEGQEDERINNNGLPPVANGPLRGSLAPTWPAMTVFRPDDFSKPDGSPGPLGAAPDSDPVVFGKNTPFGKTGGTPPDPSGASSGNVVLATGNTYASLSTDGGSTFTLLDPTTIFPSAPNKDSAGNLLDKGLCCDQVVQYVPSIDRFIWLMQFCGTGASCLQGTNRIRIAAASPQGMIDTAGTGWTYWDLVSPTFGGTLDYPDLAVGNNFLYLSCDVVGSGLQVVRVPLQEIRDGVTINFNYTKASDSSVAYGSHITQNTGDSVFWAGHNNNSQLRVFSWPENSGSYSWRNVNIDSWLSSDYSSLAPDGTNWLSFGFPEEQGLPAGGIIGAARRPFAGLVAPNAPPPAGEIWFAWTAGRGGGFPHPYVRLVRLNDSDFSVLQQNQIWNADYAYAYPCLATNSVGEVGISLAWGGNKKFYANHGVGIFGDLVIWITATSDAAINRYGDYVTVRRHFPNTELFSAVGYAVLNNTPPAVGTRFDPRYILFGRNSVINPTPQRPPS
jgi:hypothetical protein